MNEYDNNYYYLDYEKLYEEFIAVYSRVSTAQQDIQKQIALAEAYINNHGIPAEKVIWLNDKDVSANKVGLDKRGELLRLRKMIKQKKVKTIIVYSRDRLARNFYEYVALVKEFYEYNVDVIFTSTKQPAFSKKLAIEALYGIFAQSEGQNITNRKTDTQKQFPSSIFGYKREGKKKNVKYIPKEELSEKLHAFFHDIMKTETSKDFFEVLMKYKKLLKNKSYDNLLKYLQNPFYCGYMETTYGYEKLNHVEPIISYGEFMTMQEVVKEMEQATKDAIINSSNNAVIHPICHECKQYMNFRSTSLTSSGYFVCKRKHREIIIEVDKYNEIIKNHLESIIHNIDTDAMKVDLFSYLRKVEIKYKQELSKLNYELDSVHRQITVKYSPNNSKSFKQLVKQSRNIKKEIEDIYIDIHLLPQFKN
ncbi:recombinase family protein [Virgibacillus sp. SK37]|uniref:recombinase family protein n=1 Tax=Virgibacillus sp. SK37 TaxID=403957 RepID=UPI0004D10718|nr:recombinase family protein [Virgibacillus sp. SK37]AIF45159.1 hypothetical protein X953_03230 [Virgibacillus sp. SK37]